MRTDDCASMNMMSFDPVSDRLFRGRKRPYLTRELCVRTVRNPVRVHVQDNGRVRFWAIFDELGGRALRVVTLSDRRTILNAFLDRGFRP
jgi:hypothetical protein